MHSKAFVWQTECRLLPHLGKNGLQGPKAIQSSYEHSSGFPYFALKIKVPKVVRFLGLPALNPKIRIWG